MGVSISRVRSTGLIELTTDVGGVHLCTAGEQMEPWKAGNPISTSLWAEGGKLSVIFFRTRGPVGWLLKSGTFFSFSRHWAMALICNSSGGGRWMGFIKSGIGAIVVFFFLSLFSVLSFLESMEITDTVF